MNCVYKSRFSSCLNIIIVSYFKIIYMTFILVKVQHDFSSPENTISILSTPSVGAMTQWLGGACYRELVDGSSHIFQIRNCKFANLAHI